MCGIAGVVTAFRAKSSASAAKPMAAEMRHRGWMFAFAIWDGRSNTLVFARDRLGIKPLCVSLSVGRSVFGSEVKAILACGLVARRLDPSGVRAYLQLGDVPPPWSIVEHVVSLEPGHVAAWQTAAWKSQPYCSFAPPESSDEAKYGSH